MTKLMKELKAEVKNTNWQIETEKEYKEFIETFKSKYNELIGKSSGDRCRYDFYYINGVRITSVMCVEAYRILHPAMEVVNAK